MDFEVKIARELGALRESSRLRSLSVGEGVSFIHNDYLGLADHPEIREAGRRALSVYPAGSRGSRLLGGHSRFFEEAEERIASHFGAPAALLFSSGYAQNVGVVRALAELCDVVVSDESNHASLIDGITLSKKPKRVVSHHRWADASDIGRDGSALLVSESLFSMDGDFVDDSFWDLASTTDGFVVLDEAHAAGVFLEDGRGCFSGRGDFRRMAVTITFGKAFGVGGAAVLCSSAVKQWLVNRARTFVFSTAPPPVTVALILEALNVLEKEKWRRAELWSRAEWVRETLRKVPNGRPLLRTERTPWEKRSPIIPLHIPGDVNALSFSQNMRESGFDIRAIRYPTVRVGEERLRLSLSLAVDRATTENAAKELVKRWTDFSLRE